MNEVVVQKLKGVKSIMTAFSEKKGTIEYEEEAYQLMLRILGEVILELEEA